MSLRPCQIYGSAVLVIFVLVSNFTAHAAEETSTATTAESNEVAAESSQLTDQVIRLAIEKELLASQAVDSHRIDVRVEQGVVTLSGSVGHLLAEEVAVGLAQRIRGVVSIIDLIEINTPSRPEADLIDDIEAAIATDPATHGLKPRVAVVNGVATLKGEVPTFGEKALVERAVQGVLGVTEIKNELTFAKRAKVSDDVLRKEISELYQFKVLLDDAQIDAQVNAGAVVLNGVVSSAYQRSLAEQLARQAGAKSVDGRGIRVNWRHSDRMLREHRYEKATDLEIQDAIVKAWKYDPRLIGLKPQVLVTHGTAMLSGDVTDLTAKLAAERVARYTIGVYRVVNHLRVRWPDESPSDEAIVNFAREALARDPYVDAKNIQLDCENAHIGLYGVVDNEFERQHAEWTAGRIIGVVHVDNYLAVRAKWVKKSDAEIAADLKERLAFNFVDDENQVAAKVVNGVAILEGTVDSWFMWQTAVDQAMAAGAREPHVMIEVRHGSATGTPYYGPHYYVPQ